MCGDTGVLQSEGAGNSEAAAGEDAVSDDRMLMRRYRFDKFTEKTQRRRNTNIESTPLLTPLKF